MVEVMLRGFGGDQRGSKPSGGSAAPNGPSIACYHVNAQLSDGLETVGAYQFRKLFRVLRFCLEAVWCRFHYGVETFYYIPAPPKRIALYRDWIVLGLCRPFFRRTVFHWHAAGLAEWLNSEALPWERLITSRLLRRANLAISLSRVASDDAAEFQPRRLAIVANGIRDPCPICRGGPAGAPRAQRNPSHRFEKRKRDSCAGLLSRSFPGACLRQKGLFDAIEGVRYANRQLESQRVPLRLQLTVAGSFVRQEEEREFQSVREQASEMIDYVGFASPELKSRLLRTSDCLCFPSYYPAEAQPVTLIEAMAFGLSIVATNWRAIPEMLPPAVATVEIRNPVAIGEALLQSIGVDQSEQMR